MTVRGAEFAEGRAAPRRPVLPAVVESPDRSALFRARLGNPEVLMAVGGGLAIMGICVGFFIFASSAGPDTWVPVVLVVVLALISIPICIMASGQPRNRKLQKILLLSFALKMLFVPARYYMNEGYYKGEGDAARYDEAGDFFVQNVQKGEFSIEGSELTAFPAETRVVGYITGLLYLVFGTSYFGGYLVFAWLAWLGMLFIFLAFRAAMPNAPPYLAAYLIMFMPSMLYWPSSLGKDSLMVFCVGMVTLGVAWFLTGKRVVGGVLLLALGGVFLLQVRPHLLLIAAVALAGSTLSQPKGSLGLRGGLGRLLVLVLMVPVLTVGIGRMDAVFGTTAGGSTSLNESLDDTISRTGIGGSAFAASPVRTPLDIPEATITVLFRPFLFEARNVGVLLSAIEGAILLAGALLSARWLWNMGPAMYRSPFFAFCGFFALGFIIAFSNISNAGILSRQRVQLYPVLMLVVCAAYERHRLAELSRQEELERELAFDVVGRHGQTLTPA